MADNEATGTEARGSAATNARRPVRYFVCYARADKTIKDKLLTLLTPLFSGAAKYEFRKWVDSDIMLGTDWRTAIQTALDECDFGLLLISPNFLSSEFISNHELPNFVPNSPFTLAGRKIAAPVILCEVPLDGTISLRGLEKIQFFPDNEHEAFENRTTTPAKKKFANKLFKNIITMLDNRLPAKPNVSPTSPDIPCPAWAESIGDDQFGRWARIAISDKWEKNPPVTARLRWIPPGRFLMGSPENEPGRRDNEGPQHPVTLSQGFWLMDTPCTQALWQAVMGHNLSRFKSPDRPVEQVSWNDIQSFLKTINKYIPGLEVGSGFDLPTEAQWEYACRAGSTTALYTGEIEILGENNAPALDPIAWYGGNSSVGFDLDNGYDTTSWSDKQYPGGRAGTHPVGLKQPNPWGLYDMLGNVWEWCRDGQRTYRAVAETDPSRPADAGGARALRGGAWIDSAWGGRSAARNADHPDYASVSVGFRVRLRPC